MIIAGLLGLTAVSILAAAVLPFASEPEAFSPEKTRWLMRLAADGTLASLEITRSPHRVQLTIHETSGQVRRREGFLSEGTLQQLREKGVPLEETTRGDFEWLGSILLSWAPGLAYLAIGASVVWRSGYPRRRQSGRALSNRQYSRKLILILSVSLLFIVYTIWQGAAWVAVLYPLSFALFFCLGFFRRRQFEALLRNSPTPAPLLAIVQKARDQGHSPELDAALASTSALVHLAYLQREEAERVLGSVDWTTVPPVAAVGRLACRAEMAYLDGEALEGLRLSEEAAAALEGTRWLGCWSTRRHLALLRDLGGLLAADPLDPELLDRAIRLSARPVALAQVRLLQILHRAATRGNFRVQLAEIERRLFELAPHRLPLPLERGGTARRGIPGRDGQWNELTGDPRSPRPFLKTVSRSARNARWRSSSFSIRSRRFAGRL